MAEDVYNGGFPALLELHREKDEPFTALEEVLPSPEVDLAALAGQVVPARTREPADYPGTSARRKYVSLQKDFEACSELALLNGFLIAVLRRRAPPEAAKDLFLRIWREQGEVLVRELSVRWMISTVTTFADFGETGDQRALGMGLSVMFDMIKIHDCERRLSGQSGRKPFDRTPGWRKTPLAFDMDPYSLKAGDLDRNMLVRLWSLSEREPVMQPLAQTMLGLVMRDRRTIFARMQRIKIRNNALEFLDSLREE